MLGAPLYDPGPARVSLCVYSCPFFLQFFCYPAGRNVSDNPLFPFSGLAQLRGRRCLSHPSTPSAACGAFWGEQHVCTLYGLGRWGYGRVLASPAHSPPLTPWRHNDLSDTVTSDACWDGGRVMGAASTWLELCVLTSRIMVQLEVPLRPTRSRAGGAAESESIADTA
jgi:hypothetical protein